MNSDNGNHAHHKATPRMATRIRRDRYGLFAIVEVTMPDRKKALTTMRPDVTASSPEVERFKRACAHLPPLKPEDEGD